MSDESVVFGDCGRIATEVSGVREVELEGQKRGLKTTDSLVMDLQVVKLIYRHGSLRNLLDDLELKLVFADVSKGDLGLVDFSNQEFVDFLYSCDGVVGLIVSVLLVWIVELLTDDNVQVQWIGSFLFHLFDENEEVLGA